MHPTRQRRPRSDGNGRDDYGVDVDRRHWVTLEDGHVAEYREPPGVERAGPDKNLLKMLCDGELDAAIDGADLPNDPTLTSLIPDPEAAALKWYAQHRVVPINHMVVVQQKLADADPAAIKEIYRLLAQAKKAAGLPKASEIDLLPLGLAACRPALQTIINYALQQSLIQRKSTSRNCSTRTRCTLKTDHAPPVTASIFRSYSMG
jgi:4,5-dihydroxyphthalate decarboxylase